MNRLSLVVCAVVLGAAVVAASDNEFVTTWKAPGAGEMNFAGRKVAAVLITDDDSLRVSTEEALAREITARGPQGVAAYRIIPREEVRNSDAAKGWFERAGIEGLVVLRLVQTDTTKVYSSVVWSSGYYASPWAYWGNGWATVTPIGKGRDSRTITVETILYDLQKGAPIWACVSRTTDPKNVQVYVKSLTIDIVKRLEKDGLVRTRPR
jgi:hypothetical protein